MTAAAVPLRVLVVDDHALLRAGIVSVLSRQPQVEVVGEAENGLEAIAAFETLRPDVTLIDLQMPVLDGVSAIARIKMIDPKANLLVLTTFDTDEDIESALRAGARGYLLKDATPAELAGALFDVRAGKTRVAPAVAAKLAERVTQVALTVRELTVLRLLADGRSNREIASKLAISEGTVKVHVTHLLEKLDVSTRTEAIAAAAKRGLVRMR